MNNKTMLAFHGDKRIKAKYLARLRRHAAADEIIHGTYWNNGKGCAVGCTVHSTDHSAYERELGIPQSLARIEDGIFEGLANGESKRWPLQFLRAIPLGADLALVTAEFLRWLLIDPKDGVIRFAKNDRTKAAIQRVGDLYARKLKGEIIEANKWQSAATAASAASSAATYAATAASAATAATAASAAAYAASSAADRNRRRLSFTAADARCEARSVQAKKMLALLRASSSAKVMISQATFSFAPPCPNSQSKTDVSRTSAHRNAATRCASPNSKPPHRSPASTARSISPAPIRTCLTS